MALVSAAVVGVELEADRRTVKMTNGRLAVAD